MTSRPHGLNSIERREEGKQGKEEEAEGDGSLDGTADTVAVAAGCAEGSSQSYRPGKPEDGGDGQKNKRCELVE